MKTLPTTLITVITLFLLAACSAKDTVSPAAVAKAPAVTITLLTIATQPPTITRTPTAAPTDTPEPTLTSTPILPTPTPTVGYAQECITIEEQLPADLNADGALMLYGGRYASWWNRSVFRFDLMSARRSPLPYSAASLSLSPDGKWLAYIQQVYDGMGSVKDRFLKITDAEGRHLNLSYWGLNWQALLGWQDAEHVLLNVPGYPGGDYILLNPFTGEKTVLRKNPMPEGSTPEPEGESILSVSLDRRFLAGWAQLDAPGSGYPFPNHLVLIDTVANQMTDLCFENQVPSDIGWVENTAPIWSPDGRFLALAVSRIEERTNSRYTSEVLIWDTVIVDLQARRGYLLAKDARPQAWMRKP